MVVTVRTVILAFVRVRVPFGIACAWMFVSVPTVPVSMSVLGVLVAAGAVAHALISDGAP